MSSTSTFTPERTRTLHAVVARILPGTDGPGAADTAAAVAVERAIGHRALRGLRRGIEQVLDRLEAQASERHAGAFAACAPADQDALLRGLEQDPQPWTRFLWRSLIGLSLEGLLGDPVHGGNCQYRGWEAAGLRPGEVRSGLCREARHA